MHIAPLPVAGKVVRVDKNREEDSMSELRERLEALTLTLEDLLDRL